MEGFAQLLGREYGSRLDDTGRSYIKRISDAALRNDGLICDLLEFGRLAHAEMPMDNNIDLGRAVQRALDDLQEQIRAKRATIELGDKWPLVWANDSVLNQIITNLLTNSLKFVAPNSAPHIRIRAETSVPPREDGEALKPQNGGVPAETIRLYIQDDGIGIPADVQSRLFQPFQRGTADPQYQGTGMGLAIVQKGAERLGGKVGFTSAPGKGTSFWVELLSAPPVESTRAGEPPNVAPHR